VYFHIFKWQQYCIAEYDIIILYSTIEYDGPKFIISLAEKRKNNSTAYCYIIIIFQSKSTIIMKHFALMTLLFYGPCISTACVLQSTYHTNDLANFTNNLKRIVLLVLTEFEYVVSQHFLDIVSLKYKDNIDDCLHI